MLAAKVSTNIRTGGNWCTVEVPLQNIVCLSQGETLVYPIPPDIKGERGLHGPDGEQVKARKSQIFL